MNRRRFKIKVKQINTKYNALFYKTFEDDLKNKDQNTISKAEDILKQWRAEIVKTAKKFHEYQHDTRRKNKKLKNNRPKIIIGSTPNKGFHFVELD